MPQLNFLACNKNVCLGAHRGFSEVAPENTIPAYAAAIEFGVDAIEFDIQCTKDGMLVCSHDPTVDKLTDGKGLISELTYSQLLELDYGKKFSSEFSGLKIATVDEFLSAFGSKTNLIVHVKDPDNINPLPDCIVEKIVETLRKYNCDKNSCFTCGNNALISQLIKFAPDIPRCVLPANDPYEELVPKALRHSASVVGLFPPYFKYHSEDYAKNVIEEAHKCGLPVVIDCYDPILAEQYLSWGIDMILTGHLSKVAPVIKNFNAGLM